MKKNPILFWTFLLVGSTLVAQTDLTGNWTGNLTQGPGGYTDDYEFELQLVQRGDQVSGRSFVKYEDIYAIMLLEGTVDENNVLRLKETQMLKNRKHENMMWCYKTATLYFSKSGSEWILQGTWAGKTDQGDCVPGKIYLKKAANRA
ncbi:MAG TPA: hypothetical protein PKA00_22915 [Saprospiraceae bacterium]|nr:hypothetical protein [Saprospiraceae bacterium]HMQ85780.1 hypothetical protein [Saprospiraceae bacterium]